MICGFLLRLKIWNYFVNVLESPRRFRLISYNAKYERLLLGLFFCTFVTMLLTFRDYGITVDEPVHSNYGRVIVNYFANLFFGSSIYVGSLHINSNMMLYGGLADFASTLFGELFNNVRRFEAHHLFNAGVGLLTVVGASRCAKHVGGSSAAFWTALLLIANPVFYGHLFNNSKDIPFAAGYIWSIYYLLRIIPTFPNISRGLVLMTGVSIGATMAIRVGGMIVLCYLGLLVFTLCIIEFINFKNKQSYSNPSSWLVPLTFRIFSISIIAYSFMLLFWPWSHSNPFTKPYLALTKFLEFSGWSGSEFFSGQIIYPHEYLPWEYIPKMLTIQLPELTFFLFFIGAFFILKSSYNQRSKTLLFYGIILLFSIAFPIAFIYINKSYIYNNTRHLLFIIPPIFVLSGYGISLILKRFKQPLVNFFIKTSLSLYVGYIFVIMLFLHPHQYVYYNQMVGGLEGAYQNYEMDYWNNGFKESLRKLQEITNSDPNLQGQNISISTPEGGRHLSLMEEMKPFTNFVFTADLTTAEFIINLTSISGQKGHLRLPGKIFFQIERFNTPIIIVNDLRK
jgi:hypothetical protein